MPQTTETSGISARQIELIAHQETMRGCTACVEAGFIETSYPVFHGSATARIMVVGQAPAVRRVERPLPYSGATGKTLRGWLERAGFPAEALYERFYLTSLTKCFPGPSSSGKGDRPPSAAEIALCRPHLLREIELVQPEVILSLGRLSATFFAGNLPLSRLVGRSFHFGDATLIPLPHPSGVSRWLNDPDNQAQLHRALAELARLREEWDL